MAPITKFCFPGYEKREMVKQFLKSSGNDIEKQKFHSSKNPIAIGNIDINKIIISDMPPYGKNKKTDAKFFIGYKD